jgi:hypothetical protein
VSYSKRGFVLAQDETTQRAFGTELGIEKSIAVRQRTFGVNAD